MESISSLVNKEAFTGDHEEYVEIGCKTDVAFILKDYKGDSLVGCGWNIQDCNGWSGWCDCRFWGAE